MIGGRVSESYPRKDVRVLRDARQLQGIARHL